LLQKLDSVLATLDQGIVSGMGSALNYAPAIFAPASAGSLYPMIGLGGILLMDIVTGV
jgi:hypothetical protein